MSPRAPVLDLLEARFRAAADELESRDVLASSAAELRARLVLHQVRRGTRWLDGALKAVEAKGFPGASDDPAPERLFACCEGWVLRAIGVFRPAAEAWLTRIEDSPEAVPALLRYWRITGDENVLQRALAVTPPAPESGDLVGAAACWAAHQATAGEDLARAARAALPDDPTRVPVALWPLAAHVHDLEPDAFTAAVHGWDDAPPRAEDAIVACAQLALPRLIVDVQWWFDSDLFSGPVAEAATFCYPNVRLRFGRLPHPAQAVITAILDGEASEPLEDIGVISALLDDIVAQVDRTALRDAPRRRRKPSRLLRG
jgi:hypothetical protein